MKTTGRCPFNCEIIEVEEEREESERERSGMREERDTREEGKGHRGKGRKGVLLEEGKTDRKRRILKEGGGG